MDKYYILTFENTHSAINGESVLKANNIKAIVMPTPTFVTKSCGISLRLTEEEVEKVKPLIAEEKIKVKSAIFKDGSNFREVKLF
ncbi:DUF3343 domain-containing protein [Clostridium swellfunianum]|uniref:DUF3343 domain-containing protein n=1 Tax=Clostridium swellfunianum TaxID=1367462 RepID=UPI00202DC0B8|nr:DUF3343 domain-containing protein [Clostridium swellfunianum]MCM0647034.1 DUF3343 domain-containing protein [Clostridium swellfunianum]